MKNKYIKFFAACVSIAVAFIMVSILSMTSFAYDNTPQQSQSVNAQESEMTATEIIEYIKDRIIPVTVAVLSALGALYVGVLPVINKVKNASERLGKATNDVRQSNINYESSRNKIDECITKVEQMAEKTAIEQQKIKKMLEIAFCNSDELVSKGYARKIAELSEKSENADELKTGSGTRKGV